MDVCPIPFETTLLLVPSPVAPVPTNADFSQGTGVIRIFFDLPLQPGTSIGPNWTAFFNSFERITQTPVTIFSDRVEYGTIMGAGSPPVDQVSYGALNPDVIGVNLMPVAAFSNFPLIGIP